MMRRITFLAGFAAGYVAGAHAGRERYEQIASASRSFMSNPKVQHTADLAKHQAEDLAGTAKTQAAGLASTAKTRVHDKMEEHRSSDTPSTGAADDSVFVVDLNDHVGTGTGPTGTNDRMGL